MKIASWIREDNERFNLNCKRVRLFRQEYITLAGVESGTTPETCYAIYSMRSYRCTTHVSI